MPTAKSHKHTKKPAVHSGKPTHSRAHRGKKPAHAAAPAAARPTPELHAPHVSVSLPWHRLGHTAGWPLRFVWNQKWLLLNLCLVAAAILIAVSEGVRQSTSNLRYDADSTPLQSMPKRDVALVFGAGVLPDHTPSEYLRNRVKTAADLYKAGKVTTIVVSGDNRTSHYDEPTVMKQYAEQLGVKPGDVVADFAGYNTYDTCYRANHIFQVRNAVVITQGYHLPRAVMTCRHLGIDTIGLAAEHEGRDWTVAYVAREHLSTAKATVQLYLKPAPAVLGKAEPLTVH